MATLFPHHPTHSVVCHLKRRLTLSLALCATQPLLPVSRPPSHRTEGTIPRVPAKIHINKIRSKNYNHPLLSEGCLSRATRTPRKIRNIHSAIDYRADAFSVSVWYLDTLIYIRQGATETSLKKRRGEHQAPMSVGLSTPFNVTMGTSTPIRAFAECGPGTQILL